MFKMSTVDEKVVVVKGKRDHRDSCHASVQDVYSEGHRLAQDIRGEGRGTSAEVRAEGRTLQSEICKVGHDLSDDICSSGREVSQDVRYEGREIGNSVRGVSQDVRYESRELGHTVAGVGKEVRTEGRFVNEAVRDEGRSLAKAICETTGTAKEEGSEGRETTWQTSSKLLEEIMRQGARSDLLTEKSYAATLAEMQRIKSDTLVHAALGQKNVENLLISGFKDGRYDAATFASQTQLFAAQNAASAQIAFKEAQLFAAQNAAAAQLAFKEQALLTRELACQASKELAECCCEIKELVREDGSKTRDLINDTARLEAVRRDAERTAEIFYLKSKLPNGIVC